MRKERRKSKRIPVGIDVHYRFEGKDWHATTRDVSTGGFFAQTDDPITIGATTRFTLKHKDLNGPLEVVGRVIHVIVGVEAKLRGMGVQILQIAHGQDERFEEYRKLIEGQLYRGVGK